MTRQHEERRLELFDVLEDAVERFSDQHLRPDRHVRIVLGHLRRPVDVRLAQLEQPLVDDVVVELFLLLEFEDAAGLIAEDVLDVVERDVVEIEIERATEFDLRVEIARQLQSHPGRAVAVRAPVNADEKSAALERLIGARDQQVLSQTAQHASRYATELRTRLTSQPVGAHRTQIIPVRVDLADDLLEMDPLEQLALYIDVGLDALLFHPVEERVADQLQPLLDQLVVDLPLTLDLFLTLEPGGQPRLQLTKSDIVELGGVNMIAHQPGLELLGELERPVYRVVAFQRVITRDENLFVHARLNSRGAGVTLAVLRNSIVYVQSRTSTPRKRPVTVI